MQLAPEIPGLSPHANKASRTLKPLTFAHSGCSYPASPKLILESLKANLICLPTAGPSVLSLPHVLPGFPIPLHLPISRLCSICPCGPILADHPWGERESQVFCSVPISSRHFGTTLMSLVGSGSDYHWTLEVHHMGTLSSFIIHRVESPRSGAKCSCIFVCPPSALSHISSVFVSDQAKHHKLFLLKCFSLL